MTRRTLRAPSEFLVASSATCALLALGCSGQPVGDEVAGTARSELLNCGSSLGAAPLDSTCGHGWVGPFGDGDGTGSPQTPIAADANLAVPNDTPRFAQARVLYRVALPGASGANQAAVKFTPTVTEDYTFGVDADVPVNVLDPGGVSVPALLRQDVRAACTAVGTRLPQPAGIGLTDLGVFRLDAGVTYRVVLGPSAASSLNLVIDEPNDFLNAYFPDEDGDTYGDPSRPRLSECIAPPGYLADDRDCDDTNPAIHPGAAEVMDGVDNNCDGFIDTGGSYDLVTVSVSASTPPVQLLVGESAEVVVEQVVENEGPSFVDAAVTRSATVAGPGTIAPASDGEALTALGSFETRTLSTTYTIACDGDGTASFTVSANVEPTTAGVTDPVLGNNVAETTFPVECVLVWPNFGRDQLHTHRSPYRASQTNDLAWTFAAHRDVRSSAAVAQDGRVYIGSDDNKLYALGADGALVWAFETRGDVESSPAVTLGGVIYVGSDDHKLRALGSDGALHWVFHTGDAVRSSPVVGPDGAIYVGSDDRNLYAVNPDGTARFRVRTFASVRSSPALGADGTVYVGSDDHKLYAVNADGTIRWAFRTWGAVRSSPALGADGTIYVGSDDWKIYAVNPDGTKRWSVQTRGKVRSSPGLALDGTIYVGSDDEHLYAIRPDGSLAWRFHATEEVRSSPAVGRDGLVYFGSGDDAGFDGADHHDDHFGHHNGHFSSEHDVDCGDDDWGEHGSRGDHYGQHRDRDDDHHRRGKNGHVWAVKPNGRLKWVRETREPVLSSPAIGLNGAVHVGSDEGLVRTFEPPETQLFSEEASVDEPGAAPATTAAGPASSASCALRRGPVEKSGLARAGAALLALLLAGRRRKLTKR